MSRGASHWDVNQLLSQQCISFLWWIIPVHCSTETQNISLASQGKHIQKARGGGRMHFLKSTRFPLTLLTKQRLSVLLLVFYACVWTKTHTQLGSGCGLMEWTLHIQIHPPRSWSCNVPDGRENTDVVISSTSNDWVLRCAGPVINAGDSQWWEEQITCPPVN